MEHLQHFGLKQDPFQNEPDLRFFFESASHTACQRRVERGLRQNKGLSVLTGEAGTGKTLLSRRILESLEEELFEAQLMVILPGATDASSVLSRYARMLGVEEAAADRPALLGQVYERLAMEREEGRTAVLILDDAHLLERESLAEIGSLLNLEYEERRLLSLLLVGLPQLDVTLSHEASLGQRVDIRARLEPLDLRDTVAYLRHRMSMVGDLGETLPEEAMSALFKLGRGRPRLLNTLADNALFEAYLAGRKHMISSDVESAAEDLGIGSDPGNTYSALPSGGDMGMGASAGGLQMAPLGDSGVDPGASLDLGLSASGSFDPSSSALDLNEIVGASASGVTELTSAIPVESPEDSGATVIDPSVSGEIGGASQTIIDAAEASLEQLPIFEGQNSDDPAGASATRIGLGDDESAGGGDEFDDLFVELIEE